MNGWGLEGGGFGWDGVGGPAFCEWRWAASCDLDEVSWVPGNWLGRGIKVKNKAKRKAIAL